jgi:hypothetical protein
MKNISIVIASLLLIRLILPFTAKAFLNNKIKNSISGHITKVDDISLSIIDNSYQIRNLTVKSIKKKKKDFLNVSLIDLDLSYEALFKGVLAADISIDKLRLNIINAKENTRDQAPKKQNKEAWQKLLTKIIPIKVESLALTNSSIRYLDENIKFNNEVDITSIDLEIRKIYTHENNKMSPIKLKAKFQKESNLTIMGKYNLLSQKPQIDIDYKLTNFQLKKINQLLLRYLPIDVNKGYLSVYGEIIKDKEYKGYAKVFINEVDIVKINQEYEGVRHFLTEYISGFTAFILENSDTDKVAIKIPFKTNKSEFSIETFNSIMSSIKNVFESLEPKVDKELSL